MWPDWPASRGRGGHARCNGSISPDARARVLRAAEELGYQVNFLAQGLNRQRSHLIGVIVSRISDPFRSALLDALLNEIQRQGFQALVSEIHSEQDLAHTLRRYRHLRPAAGGVGE